MSKVSHNAYKERYAERQVRSLLCNLHLSETKVNIEEMSRKCLRLLMSPKEWAHALKVSRQQVTSWRAGERIPRYRQEQIIHEAKLHLIDLHGFEDEVDRLIVRGSL